MERQLVATFTPAENQRVHGAKTRRWRQVWKQRLVVAVLTLSDVSLALLIWGLAYVLQNIWGRGPLSEVAVAAVVPSVAVWTGLRAMLGLYPGYGLDWAEELRRHTYSVFATGAITAGFAVAFQFGYLLSRLLLILGFLGLLLLAPLAQYLVKRGMRKIGVWGKSVVVVGSGSAGEQVTSLLREKWELGYNPVAVFDYRLGLAEGSLEGLPCVDATLTETADLAQRQGIDTIVFAMPHTRREQLATLVDWASASFRHVMVIPNLSGITNSAVIARDLAGTFGVEIKHNLLNPWARRVKRLLDLTGAVVAGTLILPLMGLIALLIKLDSPGPVMFVQERPGSNGRAFRIYKFRTMHSDAEQKFRELLLDNPHLRQEFEEHGKLEYDPRVTGVGPTLRKFSLDELPQIWNVLKGDMSFVGPRPYLYSQMSQVRGSETVILRTPPGISGLWQVSGRSSLTFEERVGMDMYYVRNWSVWLDLVILARTVKAVVSGRGAC